MDRDPYAFRSPEDVLAEAIATLRNGSTPGQALPPKAEFMADVMRLANGRLNPVMVEGAYVGLSVVFPVE